jgi:carbamoyltransferase
MRPNEDSPYMLLAAPVREEKRLPIDEDATGLAKLHQKRSVVLAITHVDHSARVQTLDPERRPRFARILETFKEKKSEQPNAQVIDREAYLNQFTLD